MIYKSNDKYYVKVSGYLIEVKPLLKGDELDFETTQNKIEITSSVAYRAVKIDDIKDELKSGKKDIPQTGDELNFDSKPKKISERTHNKYKFNKD